ncbi:hypothetical protein JT358_09140 [Micrococcales bacterium 31B]|nr:hypothetical protein [Micrococcales bacterium 31B]
MAKYNNRIWSASERATGGARLATALYIAVGTLAAVILMLKWPFVGLALIPLGYFAFARTLGAVSPLERLLLIISGIVAVLGLIGMIIMTIAFVNSLF